MLAIWFGFQCDVPSIQPCDLTLQTSVPLHWRHNGCDCVSNHQPHDCLLNRLFRRRSRQRKHQSSASLAFVRGIHRWIPGTNGQQRGKCFHSTTSSRIIKNAPRAWSSLCLQMSQHLTVLGHQQAQFWEPTMLFLNYRHKLCSPAADKHIICTYICSRTHRWIHQNQ